MFKIKSYLDSHVWMEYLASIKKLVSFEVINKKCNLYEKVLRAY